MRGERAKIDALRAALAEATASCDAILGAIPDGIIVLEADHTVVDCNPAARMLLGVSRGEAIGRTCREFCAGWSTSGAGPGGICPLALALESGKPAREIRILRDGDGERHVEITAAPLPRREGPPRVVEVIRDVTEQARAGERAGRTSAELEGLLHALGHDLKAPLANIRGFADLLLAGPLPPEQTAHFLSRVRWNADVMGRLITDLLELMRLGLGGEPLEEVDAAEAVREALRVLEPRIAERGAVVEVAPGLPRVRYPKSRLREVFTNLIGNALEHARESPGVRIAIGCGREGAEHRFRVSDDGAGVDPAERARIFEPFYSKTKKKTGSTGLGLAIVRRIVENGGGRVTVESAPGGGAAFTFTVPV